MLRDLAFGKAPKSRANGSRIRSSPQDGLAYPDDGPANLQRFAFGTVIALPPLARPRGREPRKGAHYERDDDREGRWRGQADGDDQYVGREPHSIPSRCARCRRPHLRLWYLRAGNRVALRLDVGTRALALPDDDPRSLRNARRLSSDRVEESAGPHEPDLVHRLVERRARGHHGRAG